MLGRRQPIWRASTASRPLGNDYKNMRNDIVHEGVQGGFSPGCQVPEKAVAIDVMTSVSSSRSGDAAVPLAISNFCASIIGFS
jgi:hypothetical protein